MAHSKDKQSQKEYYVIKDINKFKKDFGVLAPEEDKNFCCFCGKSFDGMGNSTWPIYYQEDGEIHRCCDECNNNYVNAARSDHTLIMKLRQQFGINYTEYK